MKLKEIKKAVTKKRILLIAAYFSIMAIIQLTSNFLFGKNVYVLVGMLAPALLSEPVKSIFGKYKKVYVFYANVLVRASMLAIAAGVLITGMMGDIPLGKYQVIVVGILASFVISMGINITYSLSGIIAINTVAGFFLGEAYLQFAVGFLAFFAFELIRGVKFRFFLFSKKELHLDFFALSDRRKMALIAMFFAAGGMLLLNTGLMQPVDISALSL